MKKRLAIGSLVFCLAAPAAAPAQTPAPGPTPAQERANAPYDGDLQRLAEILGSLQYLRTVCGAKEGQKWRTEMQALIDAEAPSGERRKRIVARFNSGYRGFEQTYRTCTPAADLAIRRYLDEGQKSPARLPRAMPTDPSVTRDSARADEGSRLLTFTHSN